MKTNLMSLTVLAGLVLASHAWGGAARPVNPAGLTEIKSGDVRINRIATRYAIVAMPDGPDALRRTVESRGWQSVRGRLNIAGPVGMLDVCAFEKEGRFLYTVIPGSDDHWAIVAEFSARPAWAGAIGDAPGREPLGLPRFGGARRVIHFAGRGFEAACYSSSVKARSVLAEASTRLAAAGWTIAPIAAHGISAAHAGAPPVALYAEATGTGSTFLVLAGTPEP